MATVQELNDQGMQVQTQQVFFNCPQHIQTRYLIPDPSVRRERVTFAGEK